MSDVLRDALNELLDEAQSARNDQRRVICLDLLWKLARRDYHGVADCAMDLRELGL